MASIDKLHGNIAQCKLLQDWANDHCPGLLSNFCDPGINIPLQVYETAAIANFTTEQDRYLLWHCPLPFVREYLEKQCGLKTRWYHKLFWLFKKKKVQPNKLKNDVWKLT